MNLNKTIMAIAAGVLMASALLTEANSIPLCRETHSYKADGEIVIAAPANVAVNLADTGIGIGRLESVGMDFNGFLKSQDNPAYIDSPSSEAAPVFALLNNAPAGKINNGPINDLRGLKAVQQWVRSKSAHPQQAFSNVPDTASTCGILLLACLGLILLAWCLD